MAHAPTPAEDLAVVSFVLSGYDFRVSSESELQEAVLEALSDGGFLVWREHRLSERDRVDVFLPNVGLVLELKVKGSLTPVTRQLLRYAEHDEVRGILLVTTRRAQSGMPKWLHGKPVMVLVVGGL